jgi:hypothetical protein
MDASLDLAVYYACMKPSQEKLLYEELARDLVTPQRFGSVAVHGWTTELDRTPNTLHEVLETFSMTDEEMRTAYPGIPETARIYDFPPQGDSAA